MKQFFIIFTICYFNFACNNNALSKEDIETAKRHAKFKEDSIAIAEHKEYVDFIYELAKLKLRAGWSEKKVQHFIDSSLNINR